MSEPRTVWDAWQATVARFASKIALIDAKDRSFSFEELDRCLASLAPLSVGTIVGLHYPNSAEWLCHYLRCARDQAIALPIDASYAPTAARELARQVGAALLLSTEGEAAFPKPSLGPAGAHLIKLTSASTGTPKTLFFSDDAMLADGAQVAAGMGLEESDRHLALIPFGHSYGLGNLVLPLIVQGASVVCAGDPWPSALVERMRQHAVTVFPAVPPVAKGLAALQSDLALPSTLRLVISAGGLLSSETQSAFRQRWGQPVHNFYGSSETGGIAYDATGEGANVGRPLPGVTLNLAEGFLEVTSRAALRPLPALSGPATVQLADAARIEADGSLTLLGRRDNVVKIGGRRVSLDAIAASIRKLGGVEDAAVIDLPDRIQGEPTLGAVVVSAVDVSALRSALRETLPAHQRPKLWKQVTTLPYNSRGKLDRATIRAWFTVDD